MTITVAILGAGIGEQHLDAYLALPEEFTVKTICDLDEIKGKALAAKTGTARFEHDLDAVLADPDIQFVDICLPPHLHYQVALAALAAGKAVICEKPLVISLAQADELITQAKERGLMVAPVFQYRYGLGADQMQALMNAGLTGKPYTATLETHWNRPASYYSNPWRGTWQGECGGAILGHAIHIHDLVTLFMGPIESVFAQLDTRVNDIEVDDCAALCMRMTSGALVTSSVTLGAASNSSRLRMMFEHLTVESDHEAYSPAAKSWRFIARNPSQQAEIDHCLANLASKGTGYTGMFHAIAKNVHAGTPPEITLEDGRRSLALVTAIYQSARTGRQESLDISASHPLYKGWLPAGA